MTDYERGWQACLEQYVGIKDLRRKELIEVASRIYASISTATAESAVTDADALLAAVDRHLAGESLERIGREL